MNDPFSPESVVRGFFDSLNKRDYALARSVIAHDCEWWSMATGNMHTGGSAIVAGLNEFSSSFPDWRAKVDRVVASGEIAVVEWTTSGTFQAMFRGRLPNGKSFRRSGCSVAEVRKGQIVRYRDYYDRVSLLEQLDLMDLL
jgi:steroid delta-isomerase-like uncharacterized protein